MDDWIADEKFLSPDRYLSHHLNILLTSIERLINQRDTTENRANTELGWERDFDLPRVAQPIQVRSSSTNIRSSFKKRPSHTLPQLAEHPVEHTHDWELREHWIGLRVRVYGIFSYGLADLSSELFHEFMIFFQETTFLQPFLNWPSI